MILKEKLQKDHHAKYHKPYHQAKLKSMNILPVMKYCLLIKIKQ